ncbi:unnamed protein product [Hymenolepis diminuta]|uniref:Uncharacterized protein n=1 Tax=Hymenolepis diminuta TaxID=6216 RepID=A0A564XUJ2_HYMDI|nr:unnamed protein product [Hymenolepis diminuta]VUZ38716.1 unnamed protein product [Hymenolepis diminuta]
MFLRGLSQVTHIKLSLFFHPIHNPRLSVTGSYASLSFPLFLSTLPFPSPSLTGFLEYIWSINSHCSGPQLLLAHTQTPANW